MPEPHHLFAGSAVEPVDEYGKLSLPPFVGDALGGAAGAILLVGPHEADPCLTGFAAAHAAAIEAETERRRLRAEAEGRDPGLHFARARRAFGLAERATLDRSGCIRLTPWMRARGRIGRTALVLGAGATFEIWNLELACAAGDPALRELAAFRSAERE